MSKRSTAFLKVQQRAESVRTKYRESKSQFSNFLLVGDSGTGKSSMIATAPRPIFIDSFDPGGTKVEPIQRGIDEGWIVAEDRWETDSWKNPFAFQEWEREMSQRKSEGFFDVFATYALDSSTTWSSSLMFQILKRAKDRQGKSRQGGTPELQDYLVQQLTAVDWIGVLMGLPCHIIVTGHLGYEKDEMTGQLHSGLLMYGKLATKVPVAFDEYYLLRVKDSPTGGKRYVQTDHDGRWMAKSRLSGGKFAKEEEPNLRALLKKVGRPHDDKPMLFNPDGSAASFSEDQAEPTT